MILKMMEKEDEIEMKLKDMGMKWDTRYANVQCDVTPGHHPARRIIISSHS